MNEEQQKNSVIGRPFPKGVSGNPDGRPKDTEEKKLVRKASKQIIEEYKQALAEALPMIRPALVAKAMEGDVPAIREIHDRTMDKAKQATDLNVSGEVNIVFDEAFRE